MRKQIIIKHIILATIALSLAACGFFDKDNTPEPRKLDNFVAEVQPHQLWSTHAGGGDSEEYLKMSPCVNGGAIYTVSSKGTVTAINKITGQTLWQSSTKLVASTGVGAGDGIVVVGGNKGEVVALSQVNGGILWRTNVQGEILAQPAVNQGVIVVKVTDGYVHGLSVRDGHELWAYQQVEPSLILHAASTPVISDNSAFVGFANGNLAKLNLQNGQLAWQQPIAIPQGAFSIQRMIDIDANPVVFDHRLFAATYQGKISSLEFTSGRVLWDRDISSFTGMIADSNNVYVSDAKSEVWSFGADSGFVNWRQNQLQWRTVSGPASMGNYIVVGDGEGYLHWLSKTDGHFAARLNVGSPIYAAPIVENNVVYVQTNSGYLVAYTLG